MTSEQGAELLDLIRRQNEMLEEIAKQGRSQCRMLKTLGEAMVVIADTIMPPTETEASVYELLTNMATEETQGDILTTLTNIEQVADNWERDIIEQELTQGDENDES